jgi:NADH:ubiquinone oxidoreductase subunit 5 (subunit L)/multisubunit Na+/H+ antiporter MnhA subunit
MDEIFSLIILPLAAGLLLFLVPDKFRTVKGIIALLIIINAGFLSASIYTFGDQVYRWDEIARTSGLNFYGFKIPPDAVTHIAFSLDSLSRLIVVFISLFAFLIALYSLVYIKEGRVRNYYPYFLITLGCAYGAVLSDNLLLFLAFWGALGLTLYKLIHGHDEESSATAKKTLILIGASDSIMILGIAIIWKMTGSLSMAETSLHATNILTVVAFLALLIGSFTKAGAFSVPYMGAGLCTMCTCFFISISSCLSRQAPGNLLSCKDNHRDVYNE